MTSAAGLSPWAWDGRLRHSRDQVDPPLLTHHTHHGFDDEGGKQVVRIENNNHARFSFYLYGLPEWGFF